jgi:hypothetical protein
LSAGHGLPIHVMGATMPFSRYSNVDSGLMEAMRAAFHRVREVLQLDCDTEDRLAEIVITKIVELAKAGERDPQRLCDAVLAQMGATESTLSAPSSFRNVLARFLYCGLLKR